MKAVAELGERFNGQITVRVGFADQVVYCDVNLTRAQVVQLVAELTKVAGDICSSCEGTGRMGKMSAMGSCGCNYGLVQR